MADIVLTGSESGVTMIPNVFIDRYLPEADGEYVKVYLLLSRSFRSGQGISVGKLADLLDDTERDVLRALRYWDKKGLLQLVTDGGREIREIRFLPVQETDVSAGNSGAQAAAKTEASEQQTKDAPGNSVSEAGAQGERKKEKCRAPDAAKRRELAVDEDFGQLLYIVGKYLGEPLGPSGSDLFGYLYGELHMRADLLEYLVETSVDAGHKSLHYIEVVALDWHGKGIVTVDDARERTEICRKQYYQVLRAFGLTRRGPAPEEKKVMDIWFYDYGFQMDIVLEACSRTIRTIHEPSFDYAGGILADWKKKGVKDRKDIDTLDAAFAKEKESGRARRTEAAKPNRFHNFDQVGYDYDAILEELNG